MAGTAVEKLLIQVEANAQQLQQLQQQFTTAFRRIEREAQGPTAGLDAISKRVTLLSQGAQLAGTRAASLQGLAAIEAGLQRTLERGNLTTTERIRLEQQLANAQKATQVATGQHAAAVGGLQQRYAGALLVIAGASEQISRAGKITGEASKQILTQLAGIAFAFGPQGAIVGAVAIGVLSVVQFFQRTRDEAQKTLDRLREVRRESQGANLQEAARLASEQLADARQKLEEAATPRTVIARGVGPVTIGPDPKAIEAAKARVRELEQVLADANRSIVERNRETAREEAEQLGRVLAANIATNEERGRAAAIIKATRAALQDLNREAETATGARAEQVRAERLFAQQILDTLEAPGKASAKTAEQTASAFEGLRDRLRDVGQSLTDVRAGIDAPSEPTAALTQKLRELDDTIAAIDRSFGRLKDVTPQQAAEFKALRANVVQLRTDANGLLTTLRQRAADQLQRDLEQLFASMTTTRVDDLTLALQKLLKELADKGAPQTALDEIKRIQDGVIRAVRETEALQDELVRRSRDLETIQSSTSRTDDDKRSAAAKEVVRLRGDEAGLLVEIANLQFKGAKFDQERIEKQRALALVRERINALIDAETAKTASLAGVLAEAVGIASGLATAFGAGDSAAGQLLTTLGSVLRTVDSIQRAADAAGGLSNLLSSGSGLLSLAGGIGSLVGLGGQLASQFRGQPDPEEQRRAEILKENNRRLAELRDGLVDAIRTSASGADLANVAGVSLTRTRPGDETLGEPEQVVVSRSAKDVLTDLRRAGTTLDELRKIAEEFEITLSASPTVDQIRQLQEAIRLETFGAFAESFAGALRGLETEFRLFNIDDPVARIQRYIEVLADPDTGAPAIAAALSGFDLTTADGITGAREAIQALFQSVRDGGLSAEELKAIVGNLSLDEFLAILEQIEDTLPPIVDTFAVALESLHRSFAEARTLQRFEQLDAGGVLDAMIAAFQRDFADLAAQVDLSSLGAFRDSAAAIIQSFYADGELTEAEREQIAVLELLLQAFEAATTETDAFAEAVQKFRAATDAIGALVEFGIIAPGEALERRIAAFKEAFGDLAGSLDFSSAEAFEAGLKDIIASFAADGELTDAERDQIAALELLLQAFSDAAEQTETFADAVSRFFANLAERADILDIDPQAQLEEIAGQFEAELGDLLAGVDLLTADGRATLKRRLQDAYRNLLEGGIDESEQPLVDVIRRMLGLITNVADQQARAIEEFARRASDAIQQLFAELQFEFDLEGITDPIEKALRTIDRLTAADPRIRSALSGITDPTGTGRNAAIDALIALGQSTSDKDLRAQILAILQALRSIPDDQLGAGTPDASAAPAAAGADTFDGANRITVQQAEVLSDVARTQLLVLRQIELNTRSLASTPASLAIPRLPTPSSALALPALPGDLRHQDLVTAAATAGGIIHVTIRDQSSYEALPADQQAAAAEFSDRKIEQLDRALTEFAQRRNLTRGITRRTLG